MQSLRKRCFPDRSRAQSEGCSLHGRLVRVLVAVHKEPTTVLVLRPGLDSLLHGAVARLANVPGHVRDGRKHADQFVVLVVLLDPRTL